MGGWGGRNSPVQEFALGRSIPAPTCIGRAENFSPRIALRMYAFRVWREHLQPYQNPVCGVFTIQLAVHAEVALRLRRPVLEPVLDFLRPLFVFFFLAFRRGVAAVVVVFRRR